MSMRYDRQLLIPQWNQDSLYSRIAVVYDNLVGDHFSFIATALGINNATVYRSNMPKEFLTIHKNRNAEKTIPKFLRKEGEMYSFEELLKALNPESDHMMIDCPVVCRDETETFFEGHESILDFSGYALSKKIIQNWLKERDKIGIIANPEPNGIKMYTYKNGRDNEYLKQVIPDNPYPPLQPKKIDHIVAMVGSALALEEEKNILMNPSSISDTLIEFSTGKVKEVKEDYSNIKALFVGCGASSCSSTIAIAPLGVGRVDMMDNDTIDETNLNRQLPYFDAVGENKTDVLSYRIQEMSGFRTKSKALTQWFDEKTSVEGYDVVFDLVDHTKARLMIQEACKKAKVPLISIGTNYDRGQAIVYLPGQSMSIDDILGLNAMLETEKRAQQENPSCIFAKNASVIMVNYLMGAIGVHQFRKLFYPACYGPPLINGMTKYEAYSPKRLAEVRMG